MAWVAATNTPSGNVIGIYQDEEGELDLCHVNQDFEAEEAGRSLRFVEEDVSALIELLTDFSQSRDAQ